LTCVNRSAVRIGHHGPVTQRAAPPKLSPNIAVLGSVSLLMGMSSAMIYGLLPVFLMVVLGASAASVGLIEGLAEATTSFTKIFSGIASDWIGRRKSLVVLGYGMSAVNKLLFPLAHWPTEVLVARVVDRVGKGLRDSPRDALLADITPSPLRGSGFGLRLALYTVGAVAGPLAAMAIMAASGDDFRLVFWLALVPGFLSVVVLVAGVKEPPAADGAEHRFPIRRENLVQLRAPFWWVIALSMLLSLARFSPAFLVLSANHAGAAPSVVPIVLVAMYLVYSAAAYPFGALADRIDRRAQMIFGVGLLIAADLLLAASDTLIEAAAGAALWGLQMGVTQGLLAAAVADAAPPSLRGTAFGIHDLTAGIATFAASTGAGLLWVWHGPAGAYGAGIAVAALALLVLLLGPKRGFLERPK
jgi:MFS family permease